jgi:hypothetical protein
VTRQKKRGRPAGLTEKERDRIRKWFDAHVREHLGGDADLRRNILLKQAHTLRVRKETLTIASELGLTPPEQRLAECIVLLHDAGRFAQYAQYRTFADGHSENHALLGLRIIRTAGVLRGIPPYLRPLITQTIRYHNRARLPALRDRRLRLYAQLLRDGDKLDIWRLVINYYNAHPGMKNHAISIGLPETPGISPEVMESLLAGRIVDSRHMRNLNDFKLLQMGWVYDVNFVPTLRLVRRRRYLEKLRDSLPEGKERERAYNAVRNVLDERIRGGDTVT